MRGIRLVEIPGLGWVRFCPSRRARRAGVRVAPFDIPQVTIPRGMSFRTAERKTVEIRPWILKQMQRNRAREEARLALGPPTSELDTAQARRILTGRLEELSAAYGFSTAGVSIRNQKTRWGSCSAGNRINLNIQLVVLPAELRDYVLLHELVHTRTKHHGPEFWAELEGYVSGARNLRKKLGAIALQPT